MTKKELELLGMAMKALFEAGMMNELKKIINKMAEEKEDDNDDN